MLVDETRVLFCTCHVIPFLIDIVILSPIRADSKSLKRLILGGSDALRGWRTPAPWPGQPNVRLQPYPMCRGQIAGAFT